MTGRHFSFNSKLFTVSVLLELMPVEGLLWIKKWDA